MSPYELPFSFIKKYYVIRKFVNVATRNFTSSPLLSFLCPKIILIIGGIAMTFFFVAGNQIGAKGHFIISRPAIV